MDRVVAACKKLLSEIGITLADVARVGLGTPGSQDIPKGMLIEPPNHPHWHHFPIVACLEEKIGRPVSFANDANAAGFGEFWVGTGRVFSSMALLTLGTGVGGGLIIDNQLVGGRGHLEAYASASGVAARAREQLAAGATSLLSDRAATVTSRMIYEAASQGDAFSLHIIDETADYLSIGITTIVHMIDPGLVVLGGAMNFGGSESPVGRRFLSRVTESFRKRSFEYVANGTKIEFASLGGDAGYLGAAGIARMDNKTKG
jgi:glucokinase